MVSRLLKWNYKKFPLHPTFLLLFLWFIFTKNLSSFLLFFIVVIIHEFGHFIVAKKCGYKLDSFIIAPYGVNLNYKERTFDSKDEILIACAGPFINIIISFLVVSSWWILPNLYNYTSEFVNQSLMLGLFNLLPCYPLDGGRIFVGILSQNMERKKAVKIIYNLNYFFSALMFILFFATCFISFNPTLCLCAVFLILGVIDSKFESKYQRLSFYKKKVKNFSKPLFITVDENVCLSQLLKHIEINKLTIFIVNFSNSKSKFLDEETVKLLSLKYPLNKPIKEIIKQEKE